MDRPPPRLIRQPTDAEASAAEWLRYWGYSEVLTVGGTGDAGIDVKGSGVVGQVKAEVSPTGRPVIQQTLGAAVAAASKAVVFSLGGFTDQAIEWADRTGVALFTFDLSGEPIALNSSSQELVLGPSKNPADRSAWRLTKELEDHTADMHDLDREIEQLDEQIRSLWDIEDAATEKADSYIEDEDRREDLRSHERKEMVGKANEVLDSILGGSQRRRTHESPVDDLRRQRIRRNLERSLIEAERQQENLDREAQDIKDELQEAQADLDHAVDRLVVLIDTVTSLVREAEALLGEDQSYEVALKAPISRARTILAKVDPAGDSKT